MSLIDDKWDYTVNLQTLDDCHFSKLQSQLSSINENVMNILSDDLSVHKYLCSNSGSQNFSIDIKTLTEQNKQYKSEIESKLADLSNKQAQYESYKQDNKLLSQEIKETYEAFLKAKKYYKKNLKIYFTVEKTTDKKQIIFLQYFTETKRKSGDYSIRLHRDLKTCHYELVDMNPKLKSFKEIQKKIQETNDMPGAISYIRQKFIKLKQSK